MGSLRHPLRFMVAFACVLAVAAGPALGKSATRTLSFTTGSFVVNCTSSGQLCSPAEKLTFRLPRAGTLTSVTYTTPATHCSSVLLHGLLNGHQFAQTQQLAAGVSSERLATHTHLKKGSTTLGFQAQGFTGGCNAGRVLSWGGRVTVTVKIPRH